MRFLIDMNLSPQWVDYLKSCGFEAVHWSAFGAPTATDAAIMSWAKVNDFIVLTHDLDFGSILAATNAAGPSVVQLRMQDVLPSSAGLLLLNAIRANERVLAEGSLMVVDRSRSRIRILPLQRE